MHFRIFSYSPLVFVFAADMLIHVIKSLLMYLEFVGPYISHRLSHMRFAKLVSTLWNCLPDDDLPMSKSHKPTLKREDWD